MGRFVKERYSGIHEYLLNLIWRCAHEQFCVMQAYKHIFTSPSSVEKEPKAKCTHPWNDASYLALNCLRGHSGIIPLYSTFPGVN